MKIEIFNKKKKEEDDVLRLNTRVDGLGDFVVFACDEDGNILSSGRILRINENGTLDRYEHVKVKGIKTNDQGRILLDE